MTNIRRAAPAKLSGMMHVAKKRQKSSDIRLKSRLPGMIVGSRDQILRTLKICSSSSLYGLEKFSQFRRQKLYGKTIPLHGIKAKQTKVLEYVGEFEKRRPMLTTKTSMITFIEVVFPLLLKGSFMAPVQRLEFIGELGKWSPKMSPSQAWNNIFMFSPRSYF